VDAHAFRPGSKITAIEGTSDQARIEVDYHALFERFPPARPLGVACQLKCKASAGVVGRPADFAPAAGLSCLRTELALAVSAP